MDNPRLANVGVQRDSVDIGEAAQELLNLSGRHAQLGRQLGIGRAGALFEQPTDQVMVDSGHQLFVAHSM
jgi:hypothetical protein